MPFIKCTAHTFNLVDTVACSVKHVVEFVFRDNLLGCTQNENGIGTDIVF